MSNNGGLIVPYRQFLKQGLKGHFFSDFTYFDPNKMIDTANFKVSPTQFLRASYASVVLKAVAEETEPQENSCSLPKVVCVRLATFTLY